MRCSKCGKEIANDSKFCEFCGTKINKGLNRLIWIALTSIFAFGILLVIVLSNIGSINDIETTGNSSAIDLHSGVNTETERLQNIVDSLTIKNRKLEKENESLKRQKESMERQNESLKRQNASLSAKVQRFNEVLHN